MKARYDDNTILDYIEGDLADEARAAFEQQMAQDAPLRELVQRMARDRDGLRRLAQVSAPAGLLDKVQGQLERQILLGDVTAPQGHAPMATLRQSRPMPMPRSDRSAGQLVLARLVGFGALAALLLIVAGVVFNMLSGPSLTEQVREARQLAFKDDRVAKPALPAPVWAEQDSRAAPAAKPAPIVTASVAPPPAANVPAAPVVAATAKAQEKETAAAPALAAAPAPTLLDKAATASAPTSELGEVVKAADPQVARARVDADITAPAETEATGGAGQTPTALALATPSLKLAEPTDAAPADTLTVGGDAAAEIAASARGKAAVPPTALAPMPLDVGLEVLTPEVSASRSQVMAWALANNVQVSEAAPARKAGAGDRDTETRPLLLTMEARQVPLLVTVLNQQGSQSVQWVRQVNQIPVMVAAAAEVKAKAGLADAGRAESATDKRTGEAGADEPLTRRASVRAGVSRTLVEGASAPAGSVALSADHPAQPEPEGQSAPERTRDMDRLVKTDWYSLLMQQLPLTPSVPLAPAEKVVQVPVFIRSTPMPPAAPPPVEVDHGHVP